MLLSETFGRFFWIDDDLEFRSCPANVDGTGDFDCSDYVSEWCDWEGVNYDELFNIHKTELINKLDYAGSLMHNAKHLVTKRQSIFVLTAAAKKAAANPIRKLAHIFPIRGSDRLY